MTTSLIIKPEQKRLNRSIHTGVGQTNIRINLAPETGNRAQFARQMPEQRHHGSKRLDRSAEQRQGGREDVLLGECHVWVAPALQAFCCAVCAYFVSTVVCPACLCFGIASTGPDEFRKRGSIRLNDLGGPQTFPEYPCLWLT